MTALAIVPDEASATPRRALNAHLEKIAHLQAEMQRASRPAQRLKEQLAAATADLERCEADLTAIDRAHAATLRDQAREGIAIEHKSPPARTKAEAAAEAARRHVAAVQAALRECQHEVNPVSVALSDALAQTDVLVAAVMAEEAAVAIDRLARANAEFVAASTEVDTLRSVIFDRAHGLRQRAPEQAHLWLVVGNRMDAAAAEKIAPVPHADRRSVKARWLSVLDRLATNATAGV